MCVVSFILPWRGLLLPVVVVSWLGTPGARCMATESGASVYTLNDVARLLSHATHSWKQTSVSCTNEETPTELTLHIKVSVKKKRMNRSLLVVESFKSRSASPCPMVLTSYLES